MQFWFVRMSWRCSFFGSLFRTIWQILFARPKKFFSEGNEGRAYAPPLTLDRLLLLLFYLLFDGGGGVLSLFAQFGKVLRVKVSRSRKVRILDMQSELVKVKWNAAFYFLRIQIT